MEASSKIISLNHYQQYRSAEAENDCDLIKKKVTRLFKIIIPILIGALMGAGIGMGIGMLPITILVGAVLGLITGFVLSLLHKESTHDSKYSVQTLEQVKNSINNEKVIQSIDRALKVLSKEIVYFDEAFDNHALHNDITIITDFIQENQKDLKKIWKSFLKHIHGMQVIYPDNENVELDFSIELNRLKGKKIELSEVELFDKNSPATKEALKQLPKMEHESFGNDYFWSHFTLLLVFYQFLCRFFNLGQDPVEELRKDYLSREGSGLLLIKEKSSKKVLGCMGFFKNKQGQTLINEVGRDPGCARLGIGEKLIEKFLVTQQGNPTEIILYVREKNCAAKALYEKMGFKQTAYLENQYSFPRENGFEMTLDKNISTLFVKTRQEKAI